MRTVISARRHSGVEKRASALRMRQSNDRLGQEVWVPTCTPYPGRPLRVRRHRPAAQDHAPAPHGRRRNLPLPIPSVLKTAQAKHVGRAHLTNSFSLVTTSHRLEPKAQWRSHRTACSRSIHERPAIVNRIFDADTGCAA